MKPLRIVEIAKWIVLPVTAVIGVPPVASALFGVRIVDWRWVWNGAVWIAVSTLLFIAGRILDHRAGKVTDAPPASTPSTRPVKTEPAKAEPTQD